MAKNNTTQQGRTQGAIGSTAPSPKTEKIKKLEEEGKMKKFSPATLKKRILSANGAQNSKIFTCSAEKAKIFFSAEKKIFFWVRPLLLNNRKKITTIKL